MRVLWLTNMLPGPVKENLTGKTGSGLWVDHVLQDLQEKTDIELLILCPYASHEAGRLSQICCFETFVKEKSEICSEAQEKFFIQKLQSFSPQVVHIWGTEFAHSLSMVRACKKTGCIERTVIGIQGLAYYVGKHYLEGLPQSVIRRYTLRDLLRRDNLLHQQKTFLARGKNELEALKEVSHVIGRTHWDRACMEQINPEANYHFCNETLRSVFYAGKWSYGACEPCRIFTSSRLYPIKGFHYVLEAFAEVLKHCPQAVLAVPGKAPLCRGKARLSQDSYARYLGELTIKYQLQGKIQYLGRLSEQQMRAEFLKANVYVLPSTIENSSNSLGEAMLLGVPCVASYVGGTATMLRPDEGILYQSTAPYMLADGILNVFSQGPQAETMGAAAAAHGRKTHDPEVNFETLLNIYREIAEGEGL